MSKTSAGFRINPVWVSLKTHFLQAIIIGLKYPDNQEIRERTERIYEDYIYLKNHYESGID